MKKKENQFSVQVLSTNATNSTDNLKNKFYNVCLKKVYGFYIIILFYTLFIQHFLYIITHFYTFFIHYFIQPN